MVVCLKVRSGGGRVRQAPHSRNVRARSPARNPTVAAAGKNPGGA